MITVLIVMTGLMAGIYFTFSVVIMRSLTALAPQEGAKTMNKINEVIVKTAFLPLFFISSIAHIALLIWSVIAYEGPAFLLIGGGAAVYTAGMLLVTVFGNVPLNNKLKATEMDETQLVAMWTEYLHKWTLFNHVRTVSCTASLTLLALAIPY